MEGGIGKQDSKAVKVIKAKGWCTVAAIGVGVVVPQSIRCESKEEEGIDQRCI
jgi:hypothetical protein